MRCADLEAGYIGGPGGGWRWHLRRARFNTVGSYREWGLDLWLGSINIDVKVTRV